MGAIKSARPPGTVGPGGEPPKSVRLIGRYCLLAEPLCKQGKIQPPVGSFYLVLDICAVQQFEWILTAAVLMTGPMLS